MISDDVKNELKRLSEIFEASVKIETRFIAGYEAGQELRTPYGCSGDWKVSADTRIVDWGMWVRNADETKSRRMHRSAELSVTGSTPEEAVENFKNRTVNAPNGFLLSNHSYGGFGGMDYDDGPHIIRHFKGAQLVEEFSYDSDKVMAIFAGIDPEGAAKPFPDEPS